MVSICKEQFSPCKSHIFFNLSANGADWPTQRDANNDLLFPLCAGTSRQSPIDIVTASAVQRTLGPIEFSSDYKTKPIQIHWTNTGHDGEEQSRNE